MSETEDPPNLLALGVAHILIGFVVGGVTRRIFRQNAAVAVVAAAIAVAVHYNFDVPLARKLSTLGGQVFGNRSA
jgi:hypothetical protein